MKINMVDILIVGLIIFGLLGIIFAKFNKSSIDNHNDRGYNYNRMYSQE